MKKTKWRTYNDFAWTEHIVAPPEEYVEETDLFSKVIKEHSKIEARTLLHLGCGAGGNDYTFKRHLKVTGVDISKGMLEIARKLNPEVTYLYGDMRTIRLKESFGAVAIPDSIGHMTTVEDLRKAILTGTTYEATLVFLVRRKGKLEIHSDTDTALKIVIARNPVPMYIRIGMEKQPL